MTEQEYKEQLDFLKNDFELKKKNLSIVFCLSKAEYKKGDVIEDHIGKVLVEKVQLTHSTFGSIPEPLYYGLVLKKDGKPTKKEERRHVYVDNII